MIESTWRRPKQGELPITARQMEVLRVIRGGVLTGKGVSIADIADSLGIRSKNGVKCHLKALAAKGYIEVDEWTARSVRLRGATVLLAYDDTEAGRRLREALEGPQPEADHAPAD